MARSLGGRDTGSGVRFPRPTGASGAIGWKAGSTLFSSYRLRRKHGHRRELRHVVSCAFLHSGARPARCAGVEGHLSDVRQGLDDAETYGGAPPGAEYLERLLGRDDYIALAARKGGEVVGGLVAYELHKSEQECSEIYIYDLAVAQEHRREGIATALSSELKKIASSRDACVIFVQADPADGPAIALYAKLGSREDVLHFDIEVREEGGGK